MLFQATAKLFTPAITSLVGVVLLATINDNGVAPVTALARQVITPQYTITDLGTLPGGDYSYAVRINASGVVLARADVHAGTGTDERTFIWTNGVRQDLGTVDGQTIGFAINDASQVAGRMYVCSPTPPPPCNYHAFVWSGGVLTDLGALGLDASVATDINSSGQVVGVAWSGGGPDDVDPYRAFLWSGGTTTTLPALSGGRTSAYAINDAGQIAGAADVPHDPESIWHAVVWKDNVVTDLGTLGARLASAHDINEAGDVMGLLAVTVPIPAAHSFFYRDGTATDVGTLGGRYAFVRGLNENGDVIGYSETADRRVHAFLYRTGTLIDLTVGAVNAFTYGINAVGDVVGYFEDRVNGPEQAFVHTGDTFVDLNHAIPANSGWQILLRATDINDAGQIVGWGIIGGVGRAFRLDPVP